jgi:hypothetical protein
MGFSSEDRERFPLLIFKMNKRKKIKENQENGKSRENPADSPKETFALSETLRGSWRTPFLPSLADKSSPCRSIDRHPKISFNASKKYTISKPPAKPEKK